MAKTDQRTGTLRKRAVSAALAASVALLAPAAAFADGRVVVFSPPSTDNYIAAWQSGLKKKASDLGYETSFIETSRDQSEQDAAVQQELAAGADTAGYIWWPFINAAGTNSLRSLSKTGKPVIFANQYPLEGTESLWTAYAGIDDFANARTAAEMLLKACEESTTVKCDKGLIVTFPAGFSAGADRAKSFRETVDGKLEVLQEQPAGFTSQDGYKVGSQIIPPVKDDVTWVYTQNDSLASGVVQALTEVGKTPGKDVLVIGGTCHGDTSDLVSGHVIGTEVQGAFLEGWYTMQTLHKYLKTGVVKDGKVYAEATVDTPPSDDGDISRFNFIPSPPVGNSKDAVDGFKLWGWTMDELCNY